MRLVDTFTHIKSREDWFARLDESYRESIDILNRVKDPHIESFLAQLDAMRRWTDNGRQPTVVERRSISIPKTLVREFQNPPTDELYDYTEKLREVAYYFWLWLEDDVFQTIDAKDRPKTY
jgi:hypothetical protein